MFDFADKKVTVLGLGRFGGGIAVSRWLVEQGARVVVADESPAEKLQGSIEQLQNLPIQFHLGANLDDGILAGADLVVASPAVPPTNPHLAAARAAGVPITTEICLFTERCSAPVIGVTGTKGKSTTSTLLHQMLSKKYTTWFGGNIGKSLLADLPQIKPDHLVVLELSSFMLSHLSAIKWSPHVALVTMVSVDHLDWHGSEKEYVDAKLNLVRQQRPTDFAVINSDNAVARTFAEHTPAKVIHFDGNAAPRFALKLAGEHNQLNAQAAFAAAGLFGIDWKTAQAQIADFSGLTHRLQLILEAKGVRYINDSISTVPEAAIAALRSFPARTVIQIVGGSTKKNLPTDELYAALSERAKTVLCIGESAKEIAASVPSAISQVVHDLTTAVRIAVDTAVAGDVVLLSPGFPSYDQFTNFEARGEAFVKLVRAETNS